MSVQLCRVNKELKLINLEAQEPTQACTSHQAGSHLILAETIYCALIVLCILSRVL